MQTAVAAALKRATLLLLFGAAVLTADAQKDLSGAYGYTLPTTKAQPPKDKTAIPGGQLVLLKMEGNKYRFWLDVLTGPPNYSRGETDGTIVLVNDTASFDNTFEGAGTPCILKFQLSGNTFSISSPETSSYNCGFGKGVSAKGEYKRLAVQPALDNNWLRKEYSSSPTATAGKKTEIFQDENCFVPFSPRKFIAKGESFLSIAETEKSIYTEQIPSPGKFTWGWIKKSDAGSE